MKSFLRISEMIITLIQKKCRAFFFLSQVNALRLRSWYYGMFLTHRCGDSKQMLHLSHLGPAVVILQTVDGQGDHFDAAFTELTAESGSSTQLRGAHRGVVSRVGEQDSPSGVKRGISVKCISRSE